MRVLISLVALCALCVCVSALDINRMRIRRDGPSDAVAKARAALEQARADHQAAVKAHTAAQQAEKAAIDARNTAVTTERTARVTLQAADNSVTAATQGLTQAQSAYAQHVAGPLKTCQTNYDAWAAQKAQMEALRTQVVQATTDIGAHFPSTAQDGALKALGANKATLATYDSTGQTATQALNAAQGTATQLQNAVTSAQNTVNAARNDQAGKHATYNSAAGAASTARNNAANAASARGTAEAQVTAKQALVAAAIKNCRDAIQAQLTAYTAEYTTAKAQQDGLEKDMNAKQKEKSDAAVRVTTLDKRIKEITAQFVAAEAEYKASEAAVNQAQSDMTAAKAKMAEAQTWSIKANSELQQFQLQHGGTVNPGASTGVTAATTTPNTNATAVATKAL